MKKDNIRESDPEFVPINYGMELPKSPKLQFYPMEESFRMYKKTGYNTVAIQISQTKVQVKVTLAKKEENSPTRSAIGIGGFQRAEDFHYPTAVRAAFENAVARLNATSDL